jgi:hypothetical protein
MYSLYSLNCNKRLRTSRRQNDDVVHCVCLPFIPQQHEQAARLGGAMHRIRTSRTHRGRFILHPCKHRLNPFVHCSSVSYAAPEAEYARLHHRDVEHFGCGRVLTIDIPQT